MDEISVKGKKYLKAKVVARELGYTNDYVGQLCRAGKVDAELVGRTWYVNPDSIVGHKKTRYRSTKASTKRELHSELLRNLKAEEVDRREHFYEHRTKAKEANIQYETDESDLMPVTKKSEPDAEKKKVTAVELPVELADAKKVGVENQTDKDYHFVAPKRKETKFFGTLRVTDFITEVTVGGDDEEPQTVEVKGTERQAVKKAKVHAVKIKTPVLREIHHEQLHPAVESMVTETKVEEKSVAVPVLVDDEEVRLPVTYHLITATAFVASLLVAAAVVGLEATIVATPESVQTEYAFTVSNLSALIFFVK